MRANPELAAHGVRVLWVCHPIPQRAVLRHRWNVIINALSPLNLMNWQSS
jgi:hypothetical protein